MHLSVWLGFVAASALIGLLPGAGVTSIVGYALGSGRRTALAAVAGLAIGNLIAMTLSLAGVGAVLRASATAFTVLKWVGAAYLVTMGVITIIRSRGEVDARAGASTPISARVAFVTNAAVGALNPKTLVFFIAFVPQFMDSKSDYAVQAAILVATFCLVVAATDTLYVIAATRASQLFRNSRAMLWSKRAGGGVLIAAGVVTASARS
jgi:threonine/homoserine/homoserine lactone efflux protein